LAVANLTASRKLGTVPCAMKQQALPARLPAPAQCAQATVEGGVRRAGVGGPPAATFCPL